MNGTSNSIQNRSTDTLTLESPLEALRASSEFRGPVERLNGNHCNDHFALIYENTDEQFAAAIPFIRQGLERGEQCMCVLAENSREDVRTAMRDADIDVDAAVASGSLTFATVGETYLRNGSFDADEMMDFYAGAIDDATAEFDALRVAAEMEWLHRDDVSLEEWMEYESEVNETFRGEDAIAACQYNRNAFSPETIRDLVRVHPHLIYDNTVCHNFYYIPSEEFCGPERPARDVDRMLGTLLERTEAKAKLSEQERFLREQNRVISDPERSFEAKLQSLFELGCERFDLELGAMARVDPEVDRFEIEYTSADHEHFEPGVALPLSETYCVAAAENDGVTGVADPIDAGYENITVHRNFGLRAYLGTYVDIDGGPDRTFFFVSSEPRAEDFSDEELAFHQLIGQWVKYELEQHRREHELERTVDRLEKSNERLEKSNERLEKSNERLEKSNERLEKSNERLEKSNERLEKSNERLEKSNERLEQFAYAASHDLQEPLRMVSSYLQLLENRYADELDDDADEFLAFAVDGAERMRDMIDGLLKYSRVETQGEPLEPVDLEAVVDDVLDDLRVRIEETNAEITTEQLPSVEGDAGQLRQLFQNLVQNAMEYSGDEPPRIHIEAEPARRGREWRISVRDEGIGIGTADQDRIFEIFQRLHSREDHAGTGIGLALCQRIVERHGGDISVESTLGDGATFSVTLPAAQHRDS
ncbi:MEDS domain-containing protein [Haloterrigena sp. SYSU A121-1]|uniref:histidine kinase n=1 Tax=Haloterrigena gelatinilytica TaxID=2741724 RepID=A0A8J8GKJ4_9EURY|nr:MEDS domain-containing protein [Haloterrigena gelatinilytica]NUB91306.1 MEDS domain-containing protein [Haloterrigena gelatinilytica]